MKDRPEDSSNHSDPVSSPPAGVITIGNKLRAVSFSQSWVILSLVLICGLLMVSSCGREAPFYEPGTIEVTSTPEGAEIFFDAVNTGEVTPFIFREVPVNRYVLKVKLDGFFSIPQDATVELHPLENLVRDFELSPNALTITSNPEGASIFLNGVDTDEVTPATIAGVPEGLVEVQLVMDGVYISPTSFTADVIGGTNTILPDDTFTLRWGKTAMLEGFSNVMCNGCPELANNVEAFMHDSGYSLDQAIYCKFSMSWPLAGDPFYQYNIPENNARMNYYISELSGGIPVLTIDGIKAEGTSSNGTPTSVEISDLMTAVIEEDPGFLIDITADFSSSSFTPEVSLTAMREGVDLTGYTLYIALVQDYAYSEEAYQDVHDFHWLFRDQTASSPTLGPIANGETLVFNESLERADWDLDTLHVIAFVQNNTNKEILQAGISATTAHAPASLFLNDNTNNRPTLGGNRP